MLEERTYRGRPTVTRSVKFKFKLTSHTPGLRGRLFVEFFDRIRNFLPYLPSVWRSLEIRKLPPKKEIRSIPVKSNTRKNRVEQLGNLHHELVDFTDWQSSRIAVLQCHSDQTGVREQGFWIGFLVGFSVFFTGDLAVLRSLLGVCHTCEPNVLLGLLREGMCSHVGNRCDSYGVRLLWILPLHWHHGIRIHHHLLIVVVWIFLHRNRDIL